MPILNYYELSHADWQRAVPLLSFAYPARDLSDFLDPQLQRLIVAEDEHGHVIAAAVVSIAFQIAYVVPAVAAEAGVELVALQATAESLLPEKVPYYTLVPDGPESSMIGDELGMELCAGIVAYVKRTANTKKETANAQPG